MALRLVGSPEPRERGWPWRGSGSARLGDWTLTVAKAERGPPSDPWPVSPPEGQHAPVSPVSEEQLTGCLRGSRYSLSPAPPFPLWKAAFGPWGGPCLITLIQFVGFHEVFSSLSLFSFCFFSFFSCFSQRRVGRQLGALLWRESNKLVALID